MVVSNFRLIFASNIRKFSGLTGFDGEMKWYVSMRRLVGYLLNPFLLVFGQEFITAKSGIENKILKHIVDNKIVYGCVSMPSNVFANTGTTLTQQFAESHRLEEEIIKQLDSIGFNANVGKE